MQCEEAWFILTWLAAEAAVFQVMFLLDPQVFIAPCVQRINAHSKKQLDVVHIEELVVSQTQPLTTDA